MVVVILNAGAIRTYITIALLMHRWIIHVATCLMLLKLTQETIRRKYRRSHPTIKVVIRDVVHVHRVLQTILNRFALYTKALLVVVWPDHQVLHGGVGLREP